MERPEITNRIKEVLMAVLELKELDMREEMTAEEVDGWDSLSHMIIISQIEKAFGITFKLRELNKLKNIKSLIDLVESKL